MKRPNQIHKILTITVVSLSLLPQSDGSLRLTNLSPKDGGTYTCSEMVPTFTTVQIDDLSSTDDSNGTTGDGILMFGLRNDTRFLNNSNSSEENEPELPTSPQFDSTPDRYVLVRQFNVKVRTPPLAVSNFFVRASTIIAVLVWEVLPNRTGGYAIRDFTSEMRRLRMSDEEPEERWETIDPRHISPNAVSWLHI